MKYLLILSLLLIACSKAGTKKPGPGNDTTANPNQGPHLEGVDVGNMTGDNIPQSNATITFGRSWIAENGPDQSLIVKNKSASEISFSKSKIKDLTSPSAHSLKEYLKGVQPNQAYESVTINGLEGVRTNHVDDGKNRQSTIYLISELGDFIQINSDLKSSANGIAEGEEIIASVRVKYKGVQYQSTKPLQVTIEARSNGKPDRHAYAFWGDCFMYSDEGCNPSGGVAVSYEGDFSIGTAGADHGRIVSLGPEKDSPFESIYVDGAYLVAKSTKTKLEDIYTTFTPEKPTLERNDLQLKAGHVYLVRTINWPDEDLITKMRVDQIETGKKVTITYEKLVYVPKVQLEKQVAQINDNTINHEMPLESGQVTLYSRSHYKNYFYASFNFEYSTSGNMFITRNSWDVMLSGENKLTISVPHSGSGMGDIVDVGAKDINSVTLDDFPDPNDVRDLSYTELKKGHTYLVYHFTYGETDKAARYGALKVLDINLEKKWARLQFRRIQIGKAPYFQNWIELDHPQGLQKLTLVKENNYKKARFYPYINKRGDEDSHYHESLDFHPYSPDSLMVDSRPYGNNRGFVSFGQSRELESITLEEIESKKGQFSRSYDIKSGEVVAVLLENYYNKTIFVFKVEKHTPQKSVELTYRYLYRGKTAYSDDPD